MMLRPALLLGLIAVLGLASPAGAQVLKGGVQENVGGPAPSPSPAPGLPQSSIPSGVSLYPGEFLTGGGAQCDATLKQVAQRGGWCMAQGVPGNEYCRCYDPARVPAPSSPLQSGVQGNGPGGTGNPPLGGGVNGGPGGSFGTPPGTNGGPPTGANTGAPTQPGYPGQGYPAPANSAPSASGPHRVGSTWSCRACDPELCYKQSAEITACRPAATAGNPPPGGVLKRYPPDRVICQAGGRMPLTGGVETRRAATALDVSMQEAQTLQRRATKVIDFTPLFNSIRMQELESFGFADGKRGRQDYQVDLTFNRDGSPPLAAKVTGTGWPDEIVNTICSFSVPPWPQGSALDQVTLGQHLVVGAPGGLQLTRKAIVLEIQGPNGVQVIRYTEPVPQAPKRNF